ncbi:DUF4097 family beta strand repeat protein [Dactylosporangium vinaceum]|uniref:DUF4097 domain-containing protein n=1 Tax=Dactylosporangium vinaceum TaxID=53362 RepID=A0ABV5LZJ7_9ACTN|nr:DUF4097 family beta strand repeat-containing protein [Dactylosporangium vinaceum]UAB92617.1 DUF4097 family beta strand repeat protein [Dactylosporangium vinaceum]
MPTFDTPQPITVSLDLGVGHVRIFATDRADTVVEVRPTDPAEPSDVDTAAQVRTDLTGGTLRITGPRPRMFDFSRKTRSVELTVEVPRGSRVAGELQLGDFRCTGPLGDCRLKTGLGNVWVEQSGSLRVDTGAGDVTAGGVAGDAEIATGTGKVQLGTVDGAAVVKNSNGESAVEAAGGDVRIRNANGRIAVGRAGAGVDAKTSLGDVRLGAVTRGSVITESALGDLEIGIAAGTAAWLEVNTGFGHVRNELTNTARPEPTDETVEVRGRTSYGDVIIRRA